MPKYSNELNALKAEYDFLHKKIGELEWQLATIYLGKTAIHRSEIDMLHDQLENYRDNMGILIEKVRAEVSRINHAK
mgnify:CR=1 FL=1